MSAISGVSLTAGNVYYVGSVNGIDNDGWMQDPSVLIAAPQITYLSRQFEFSSGGLVFPDLAGSGTHGILRRQLRVRNIISSGTGLAANAGKRSAGSRGRAASQVPRCSYALARVSDYFNQPKPSASALY